MGGIRDVRRSDWGYRERLGNLGGGIEDLGMGSMTLVVESGRKP